MLLEAVPGWRLLPQPRQPFLEMLSPISLSDADRISAGEQYVDCGLRRNWPRSAARGSA
jgi:hypothetical protein